jgi:hypothetical protein
MRRHSARGCYAIDGIHLRRLEEQPLADVPLVRWRERQADLWVESATISHLHHHLTAEESGLWTAMWKELQLVDAAVARLETDPACPV